MLASTQEAQSLDHMYVKQDKSLQKRRSLQKQSELLARGVAAPREQVQGVLEQLLSTTPGAPRLYSGCGDTPEPHTPRNPLCWRQQQQSMPPHSKHTP